MRSTHTYRIAVGVVAVAVACGTAGLAAARPFNLNANGTYVPTPSARTVVDKTGLCSEVCSGGGYSSPSTPRLTASSVYRARVAGVVHCPPRAGRCVSPASVPADTTGVHSARSPVAGSPDGFQWGDAGIGAAGMLLLLSAGGAATIAGRRQHHRATTS
jgi:hypothetical protein